MTELQRIIKIFSLALALLLAFGIIASVVSIIGEIFMRKNTLDESIVYDFDADIKYIEINIDAASLNMILGDEFAVSSNIDGLEVRAEDNVLRIEQKRRRHIYNTHEVGELIITLPRNFELEKIVLNAGAGDIDIEMLSCKVADMDFGAGRAIIHHINVSERARIDTGAGELDINDGSIKDLDLDLGVGSCDLTAELLGRSSVSCGVGRANITVVGELESYTVDIRTGIGQARLNGVAVIGERIIGVGEHKLSIDGGIGEVNINFATNGTDR